jgi:hypothetical protein
MRRVDSRLAEDVQDAFGSDADEVMRLLTRYGSDPSHREVDRVHRAVIVLSQSDLERVGHFVEVALTDYRDVIMWAEYPPDADEPRSYDELRARLRLPPEN